jgi:ankyrin repeat protein
MLMQDFYIMCSRIPFTILLLEMVQGVVLRHTIMAAEAAVEAIHVAVQKGDTEAVARMLDEEPRLLSSTRNGYHPLDWAAIKGSHPGMAKLLLDRGADANSTTSNGTTALHSAALRGHEEVVSLLLTSGADVYRRNASGDTALMWASGHVAVVRLLLRSMGGCGLDERGTDGRTALWYACYIGHTDVVRALLLAGADHTIVDNDGRTPKQIAQNRGHRGCTALTQVSSPSPCHAQLTNLC